MSDPVDTGALRNAGKRADYYQTGDGPLWRAAADEVDRLRDRAADDARDRERLRLDFNARAAEASRLRAVIENAPHDESVCDVPTALLERMTVPCTCWKADAL